MREGDSRRDMGILWLHDADRNQSVASGFLIIFVEKAYHVYCDNFFTSVPLFEDLLKDGIYACWTFNPQRRYFPSDLKPFVKRGLGNRGDREYRQLGDVQFAMWQDTRPVFMLSTNARANAEQTVRRRQKDGSFVDVPCPESIRMYNQFMGGVNRGD